MLIVVVVEVVCSGPIVQIIFLRYGSADAMRCDAMRKYTVPFPRRAIKLVNLHYVSRSLGSFRYQDQLTKIRTNY